jgi:DNA polymerase III delta subunit
MGKPVRFGVYWGDPLLVERAVGERLVALGEAERVVLFGDEVSLGQLLGEIGTPSLFSGAKALVVRWADPLRGSPRLAQAGKALPESAALFLMGKDLRGRVARAAEEAQGFPTPTGRALRELARKLLMEAGLPASLAEPLAEACGGNTLRLAREVEKLVLWRAERLPPERARELLFFSQPAPYAFLDAVAERDNAKALAELNRLLGFGWDPFRLFWTLPGHLRALLAARAAQEAGRRPPGPDWLVRRRLAQANRHSQSELVALLSYLQELDLGIKTGRMTPAGALYLFTLRLRS